MEGIKLNTTAVLEDLERIKPEIENMVKAVQHLDEAQETYKTQFQDEIAQKSSKMIDEMKTEIEALKDSIKKIINDLIEPLEQLEQWRNW